MVCLCHVQLTAGPLLNLNVQFATQLLEFPGKGEAVMLGEVFLEVSMSVFGILDLMRLSNEYSPMLFGCSSSRRPTKR